MDKATQYFGELSARNGHSEQSVYPKQMQKTKKDLDQATAALIQFQIEHKTGSLESLLRSQESLITNLKSQRDAELARGNVATATSYDQVIARANENYRS